MSGQGRRLGTWVHVGGRRYGPEDGELPDEVAAQITNPKVWAVNGDEPPVAGQVESATSRSGARLAAFVHVGGRRYGPGDLVPDDVAAQITNPKAWEGGVLPSAAGGNSGSVGSEGGGDPASDDGEGSAPPPRSGPGSSQAAWEKWAADRQLTYPEGAKKPEIIAAAEDAGLIDKQQ